MTIDLKTLQAYLQNNLPEKHNLSILNLEKIADGWESNNHRLSVEYTLEGTQRADWLLRIYSGSGSAAKAEREFRALTKLLAANYPVPQAFLLETNPSLFDGPFILTEFIHGHHMWHEIDHSPDERKIHLLDSLSQLFVRLHSLDWKQFNSNLPDNEPFFFIDRMLEEAGQILARFPDFNGTVLLDWISSRRSLYACTHPSPVHQDFHPANILVSPDGRLKVIDWTNFDVTDYRFDLAWSLVLANAYGGAVMRSLILQGYERHAGKPVENIEAFEAISCARRLLDLSVSLTQGAEAMGMREGAAEVMRANLEPHRRVYRRFYEITQIRLQAVDQLFGSPE
jgi:aminoglycoside phosphotransferase (APT) family kinase protein